MVTSPVQTPRYGNDAGMSLMGQDTGNFFGGAQNALQDGVSKR